MQPGNSEKEKEKEKEIHLREGETDDQADSDTIIVHASADQPHELDELSERKSASDPTSSSSNLIGKTIGGHYQIISLIGEGAMGAVYKAMDLLLDRTVALKIISPERRIDSKAIQRFQQEAKAIASLNHRNIVQTYEFGISEDDLPYLAMEYMEGETLAHLVSKSGKQTVEDAIAIITQVGQGLLHAHDCGVIHRDLKPENIVLSKSSEGEIVVKILDFGIAKITNAEDGQKLTQTGEVFGSPLYMSPEQCHGKKLDHRSDIYSLACVFYELLTASPPFRGDSVLETLMHHIQTPVPDIPKEIAPSAINEVLQKALAKEPEARFQTVKHFLESTQKAVEDTNVSNGVNDPRFWRNLDRRFGTDNQHGLELFKQRTLSRLMFYSFSAIIIVIVATLYLLYTNVQLARSFQFDDETAWSNYFDSGKRAFELKDYATAEKLLLQAEANAEFTDNKQRRIAVLKELQKLYTERGLTKESNRIGERLLLLQ